MPNYLRYLQRLDRILKSSGPIRVINITGTFAQDLIEQCGTGDLSIFTLLSTMKSALQNGSLLLKSTQSSTPVIDHFSNQHISNLRNSVETGQITIETFLIEVIEPYMNELISQIKSSQKSDIKSPVFKEIEDPKRVKDERNRYRTSNEIQPVNVNRIDSFRKTTSATTKGIGTFGMTQQQSLPAFQARKTVLRQSNKDLTPSVDYLGPRSTFTRLRLNNPCATATYVPSSLKHSTPQKKPVGANPTLGFSLESAGTDYCRDQECDREFERTRRSLGTIGEDEFPDYRHELKFKSRFPQLRNNEDPTWNVNTTSTGMKSFGTFGKTQQQSSPAFQARKTVLRQSNDYLTPSVDYSGLRSTSTRRRLNMSCATATYVPSSSRDSTPHKKSVSVNPTLGFSLESASTDFRLDQESDRESRRTLTRYTDAEYLEDSLIIGSLDTDAGELVTFSEY
ncbi:GSCOCG00013414001-RA-CDS [Cotesia congregata]|nr:GSCOCG00013414001-RA-CDS [Cotesia congregata]